MPLILVLSLNKQSDTNFQALRDLADPLGGKQNNRNLEKDWSELQRKKESFIRKSSKLEEEFVEVKNLKEKLKRREKELEKMKNDLRLEKEINQSDRKFVEREVIFTQTL